MQPSRRHRNGGGKVKAETETGNAAPRPLVYEEMRKAGAARKRLLETVVVLASSSSFVSFVASWRLWLLVRRTSLEVRFRRHK
jgi:hypothetical protein